MGAYSQDPLDDYIISNMIHKGTLTEEEVLRIKDLAAQSLAPGITLTDLLVERGYLDYEDRKNLTARFEQMASALSSSYMSASESHPEPDAAEQSAPGLDDDRDDTATMVDSDAESMAAQHAAEESKQVQPEGVDLESTFEMGDDSPGFDQTNDMSADFDKTNDMSAEAPEAKKIRGAIQHVPADLGLDATHQIEGGDADQGMPRDMQATLIQDRPDAERVRPELLELDRTHDRDRQEDEAAADDPRATIPHFDDAAATVPDSTLPYDENDPAYSQPTETLIEENPFESGSNVEISEDAETIQTIESSPLSHDETGTIDSQRQSAPTSGSGSVSSSMRSMSLVGEMGFSQFLEASRDSSVGMKNLHRFLSEEELQRIESAKSAKPTDSILGTIMGGHVVIDRVGAGAMGEVYLAKQLSLDRYVALKVLPDRVARNQTLVEKFLHEANILAKVNHINVVKVYDVQMEANGRIFFTMELVKGQTLKDLIEADSGVTLPAAINIIKQCCRAFSRMAKEGITHRDIKPGNILLDDQGVTKVVDFGLADLTQALAEKATGHLAGTPYYIPPESLQNLPATQQSDQYSLGATFFHLITGRVPFEAKKLDDLRQKHLEEPVPAASSVNTEIPRSIDAIITKMMAKKQEDRYDNFQHIFEELEKVEAKLGLARDQDIFLGNRLVSLSKTNVKNLRRNIVAWGLFGLGASYAAAGLNALAWQYLQPQHATYLMDWNGLYGTYLVSVAYLIILYIGAVRKRLLPAWGSLRTWLQIHMATAFVGSMMLIYHSGNILRDYVKLSEFDRMLVKPVALLPLANTAVLILIVMSGLIGRFIFTSIHKQLQLENIAASRRDEDQAATDSLSPHAMMMLTISHRMLAYWRVLHYPLTIIFFLLTALHIGTVLYYGGEFMPTVPDAGIVVPFE